jgi:hypothetical protein
MKMKYRRTNPREKLLSIIHNGLTGLGLMVVVISFTQGLNGIIGIVLLMLIISAFYGLATWIAGLLEGLVQSRQKAD